MTNLQIFKNELFEVNAKLEDGTVLFDAEQVAINLGFIQNKNGKEYVRWETLNRYLSSQEVGKGSLLNEAMVYKLAFKASNETAEKFQDWLAIEVIPSIRKTGSYSKPLTQAETLLAMMQQQVDTERKQLAIEQKQNEQQIELNEVKAKQDNIFEIVSLDKNDWKEKTKNMLNKMAIAKGGGSEFQKVRNESYELLENRAKCKLNIRLENRKKDALLNGLLSKSKINAFNKLDVINSDNRLTEIYLSVVKDMAIKYNVKLEGLGA